MSEMHLSVLLKIAGKIEILVPSVEGGRKVTYTVVALSPYYDIYVCTRTVDNEVPEYEPPQYLLYRPFAFDVFLRWRLMMPYQVVFSEKGT